MSKEQTEKPKKEKGTFFRKASGKLKIGKIIFLTLLCLLLLSGSTFAYIVFVRPALLFRTSNASAPEVISAGQMSTAGEAMKPMIDIPSSDNAAAGETPAGTDTSDSQTPAENSGTETAETPAEATEPQQPTANIVNVLLIGIDAYEDGGTTSGTEPHTDVVMICAINFDTNTVDLISIPRDTFTLVNDCKGIYRLNSVFNIRGGLKDTDASFEMVRRLAEQWIDGISIPYYYAFDFQAVIDFVDAIGGVDYNVDISNVHLHKGQQHLDGFHTMQYLRYRVQNEMGDVARTERQRRMLITIFNQLKAKGIINNIPALVNAVGSGIYTNTNLAQTTALATYAASTSDLKINSRIMNGLRTYTYDWSFSFADPDLRAQIMKEVYGVDAVPVRWASARYEDWLHLAGFTGLKHIAQAEKVFSFISENYTADSFTEAQKNAYVTGYNSYLAMREAFTAADEWYLSMYRSNGKFSDEEKAERDKLIDNLKAVEKVYREDIKALADAFKYKGELHWNATKNWFVDLDINETRIDWN